MQREFILKIFIPMIFFVSSSKCDNRKWMNDSYAYWDNLRLQEDASLSGVTQLSAYVFSSTDSSIVRVSESLSWPNQFNSSFFL